MPSYPKKLMYFADVLKHKFQLHIEVALISTIASRLSSSLAILAFPPVVENT